MASGETHSILIIGAGAAGIAAARRLKAAGLNPLLIEARDRIGGRAHTAMLAGHAVDLGCHWLHAARSNPLVKLARAEGLEVSRAIYRFRALKDGKGLGLIAGYGLDHAWEKAEERIFEAAESAARAGRDLSVAQAVGNVGPWTRDVLFMHANYDCGMEAERISAVDFAVVEDDRDMLVEGGLGRLVTHLAQGLACETGAEIIAITQGAAQGNTEVEVRARDGRSWRARQVIVTLPLMVLAAGGIAFDASAAPLLSLAARFLPAAYEHVVIQAVSAPWSNRHDEIVFSMAGQGNSGAQDHAALFAHVDGTDLHYLDLVAGEGRAVAALDEAGRAAHARAKLTRHFGDVSGVEILAVTNWAADPFSRGAWAMAAMGGHADRAGLRQRFGALLYAGEAASDSQWGTVGGAWLEGTRAAEQALAAMTGV